MPEPATPIRWTRLGGPLVNASAAAGSGAGGIFFQGFDEERSGVGGGEAAGFGGHGGKLGRLRRISSTILAR